MKHERAKFVPSSKFLAMDPGAFDLYFDVGRETEEIRVDENGIARVNISGPLEHHACWFWDNYDDITRRVASAFEHEESRAVVMSFDSPGGLAAGATECHRAIKALRKKHDKPLFSYANEMACSAAYELACAADEIWLPDTATVGSVGVILMVTDSTKALAKAGLRVQLVTVGSKKADMHPERPLTQEILDRAQDRVDYFAGIFFDVVSKARGVSIPKIAGLQAGVYQGNRAVKVKLADGVAGWDDFLAHVKESTMKIKSSSKKPEAKSGEKSEKKDDEALEKALGALLATAKDPKALVSKLRADMRKPEEKSEEEDEEEETEEEEDDRCEDEEDEEEEEESTEGSTSSTKSSTSDSTDAEEEEKAFFGAKNGLYTPRRLVRLCRQVTGERGSIKSLFGALDALGVQKKHVAKSSARLEKLEARARSADVDAMIGKAKREGRVTRAQVEGLRAQGMKDPKFLKGFLSGLPKLVRGKDEAFEPRHDVDGQPIGVGLSSDQRKIVAAATAGMNPKEKAEFIAAMNENAKLNGAAKPTNF